MGSRWRSKKSIRHKHRYSDEQKQVAVEHDLNHGCGLTVTNGAIVIHTQRLKSDPGGNLLS